MVAPVLDDYSYQYDDDGIVLNANDSSPVVGGAVLDVQKISGLDLGTIRTSMKVSEGQDGGTVEGEFLDPRTVVIDGILFCHADESIEAQLDRLKYNFRPRRSDAPLYIKSPGVDQRVLFCKSLGFRYDVDAARRYNSTNFQVILQAQDPIIYGSLVKSINGVLSYGGTTGHGFNHGYDLSFGGITVPSNQMMITNSGNKAVGAEIRLFGPVSAPRITSDTVGKTLYLTLAAATTSDYIDVDLKRRTIKLNGESRRFAIQSEDGWFLIEPGVNVLRYHADSSTTVALTGSFRDGYY